MFKKLAICSFTAVMFGTGSVAFADTGFQNEGAEGKSLYTAITVPHGCGSNEKPSEIPVIAQSALFPNATDSVAFKIDPATKVESPVDLGTVITGANGGVTTLQIKGVQELTLFKSRFSWSILDAKDNVRGLKMKGARLDPTMIGITLFNVSGIKFEPTSCAKSLQVRVAIANWCTTSANTKHDRRVDVWMGHMTSKFNDPDVMPDEPSPYWPTLIIKRDLTTNPLTAACGTGYEVAVQPSDADIDASLPIKGYWPKH